MKEVASEFLGTQKALNYQQAAKELLQAYKSHVCNMSLKLNYLHANLYLEFSQQILEDVRNTVNNITRI